MIIRQSNSLRSTLCQFLVIILTFFPIISLAKERSPDVVLYGTSWCGYCQKARAYFRSLDIEFTDYDIEKSPVGKQKYHALNGRGVPLILIGSQRIDGFNMREIESALATQG